MLNTIFLISILGLGSTKPHGAYFFEQVYEAPKNFHQDYSGSNHRVHFYNFGGQGGHFGGHGDHYGGHPDHFGGRGGHYHHHQFHYNQKTKFDYGNKKFNFGFFPDSSFGESSPKGTRKNYGPSWIGEDFGRPWESSTKYPVGHELHNHPPGHPWHNPNVPWEPLEEEEEVEEVPDPSMFPFGDKVTQKPRGTTPMIPGNQWNKKPYPGSREPNLETVEPPRTTEKPWKTSTEALPTSKRTTTKPWNPPTEIPEPLEPPRTIGSPSNSPNVVPDSNKPTQSSNFEDSSNFPGSSRDSDQFGQGTNGTPKPLSPEEIQGLLDTQKNKKPCPRPIEELKQLCPIESLLPGQDPKQFPLEVQEELICSICLSIINGTFEYIQNNLDQNRGTTLEPPGNSGTTSSTTEGVPEEFGPVEGLPGIIYVPPEVQETTSNPIGTTPNVPTGSKDQSTSKRPSIPPSATSSSTGSIIGSFPDVTTPSPRPIGSSRRPLPSKEPGIPEGTTSPNWYTSGERIPEVGVTSRPVGGGSKGSGRPFQEPEVPQGEVLYVSNGIQSEGERVFLSKVVPDGTKILGRGSPVVNVVPIVPGTSGSKTGAPLFQINPPVIFVYHGDNGEAKIDIPVIPEGQDITFQFQDKIPEVLSQKTGSGNPILIINHGFNVKQDQRSQDINFIQDLLTKIGSGIKSDLPTFSLENLPPNVQVIEDRSKVEELKSLLNIPKSGSNLPGPSTKSQINPNPLKPKPYQSTILEISPDTANSVPMEEIVQVSKEILNVLKSGALENLQIAPNSLENPQTIQKLKNDIKKTILDRLVLQNSTDLQTPSPDSSNLQIQEVTEKIAPRKSRRRYRPTSRKRTRRSLNEKEPTSSGRFQIPNGKELTSNGRTQTPNGKEITSNGISSIFNIQDLLPKGVNPEKYSPEVLELIQKEIGSSILEGFQDYVRKNDPKLSLMSLQNDVEPFQKLRDLHKDLQISGANSRKVRGVEDHPELPGQVKDLIREIFHNKKPPRNGDDTIRTDCRNMEIPIGNGKCGVDFSFIPDYQGSNHGYKNPGGRTGSFHGSPYDLEKLLPGQNPQIYPKEVLEAIQKEIGGAIAKGQQIHRGGGDFGDHGNVEIFGTGSPNKFDGNNRQGDHFGSHGGQFGGHRGQFGDHGGQGGQFGGHGGLIDLRINQYGKIRKNM